MESPAGFPAAPSGKQDDLRGSGFMPDNRHRGYNGYHRGTSGGGGPHHNGHGNWRGSGGRGAHAPPPPPLPPWMQHPGLMWPISPPPPPPAFAPALFIGSHPPVRPFPQGMYYVPPRPPFVGHSVPRAVPFTMYNTVPDHLRRKLVTQIEYYFSNENLQKDEFLRRRMDDEGWVPISLIAGFNLVKRLTNNVQLIADALQSSKEVEVQGDKIRCSSDDRQKWILPPSDTLYGTSFGPPNY